MEEIWKDISGYEGYYQISDFGNVKRIAPGKGARLRPLAAGKDNNGYLSVVLCKNGKPKSYRIHTLVARAFLPTDMGRRFVNHKNGIKADNSISNLEWVTNKENIHHAINHLGLDMSGEKAYWAKLSADDVKEIRYLYKNGNMFQRELGEMFGVSRSNIGLIINRINWKNI